MPLQPLEGLLIWSPMRNHRLLLILWVLVFLLGALLRLPRLEQRPMHTDEAVHAVKFAALLQEGSYTYDADEYHGPTLYYFTLVPAWLRGERTFAELSAATLRSVPLFFGLGLILLPLLLTPFTGRWAALAAGLWTALSPMQIFYSRYYIQENLFVFAGFLTLMLGARYFFRRHWGWAAGAGAALGLLHATKETDILLVAAAVLAGGVLWLRQRGRLRVEPLHLLIFLAAALLVSALLLTAGFTHLQAFADSFTAYSGYLRRGAGNSLHLQPWYHYLRLLFFFQEPGRPLWSEAWLLPFVVSGCVLIARAFLQKEDSRRPAELLFIALFTAALWLIYAVIPYKTPWNGLVAHYGLLLIAGVGTAGLLSSMRNRTAGILLLACCALPLGIQAHLLNTTYASDPGNPWVYAHPGADLQRISILVEAAAGAGPDSLLTPVEIIATGDQYWPLPWSLRRLLNIGWYSRVDTTLPAAPIILCTPDQEQLLLRKLYEIPPAGERSLYLPLWREYAELRPGVEIRGYIRKEFIDASGGGGSRAAAQ